MAQPRKKVRTDSETSRAYETLVKLTTSLREPKVYPLLVWPPGLARILASVEVGIDAGAFGAGAKTNIKKNIVDGVASSCLIYQLERHRDAYKSRVDACFSGVVAVLMKLCKQGLDSDWTDATGPIIKIVLATSNDLDTGCCAALRALAEPQMLESFRTSGFTGTKGLINAFKSSLSSCNAAIYSTAAATVRAVLKDSELLVSCADNRVELAEVLCKLTSEDVAEDARGDALAALSSYINYLAPNEPEMLSEAGKRSMTRMVATAAIESLLGKPHPQVMRLLLVLAEYPRWRKRCMELGVVQALAGKLEDCVLIHADDAFQCLAKYVDQHTIGMFVLWQGIKQVASCIKHANATHLDPISQTLELALFHCTPQASLQVVTEGALMWLEERMATLTALATMQEEADDDTLDDQKKRLERIRMITSNALDEKMMARLLDRSSDIRAVRLACHLASKSYPPTSIKRCFHMLCDSLSTPLAFAAEAKAVAKALSRHLASRCCPPPLPSHSSDGARLPEAVLNSEACDITFVVEGRKYRAWKVALMAASPSLWAWCNHLDTDMADSSKELVVPHQTYEAFEVLMRYVHTGAATVPPNTAMEVLDLAERYQLEALKNNCEIVLIKALTIDNLTTMFKATLTYPGVTHLQRACINSALKYWGEGRVLDDDAQLRADMAAMIKSILLPDE